ncbi:glycosyltransferase family 2 protein [Methylocapsa palsarum]|uniref:Glycosyl transferase family 2 n=1 Tax=Methylocapsa palsarum TaxID=1612308 RepID=A0A1I3WPJ8_9HYPH|nr:glycosyltransferase family 2 protein [Methylocapsa palsarum]SFK09458.1 Glycosyl transferase family 2 [Methylocapsa palsarum]
MLYSFVVPTRDRHDVLKSTIESVLRQTHSEFELVIMDNASSPETKKVVDSFSSPHIRYFRSEKRLAMTDNWELALEYARGDYINFLGDDDGPLPDAVEIAKSVHARWPSMILAWKPLIYFWPKFLVEEYQNLAHVHIGSRIEFRNSKSFLKDIYSCSRIYNELPSIYDAFVPRDLIANVKAKYGRYFLSRSPDIGSGLVNAWSTETFLYSYRALAVRGVSHHSTGAAFSYFPFAKGSKEAFELETEGGLWKEQLHPKLEAGYVVEIAVANELLQFKDKYYPDDDDVKLDMAGFVSWFSKAAPRFMSHYDKVVEAIHSIAAKNGVDPAQIEIDPVWTHIQRAAFFPTLDKSASTVSYSYYPNSAYINNIADFTSAYASALVQSRDIEIIPLPPQPVIARKRFFFF